MIKLTLKKKYKAKFLEIENYRKQIKRNLFFLRKVKQTRQWKNTKALRGKWRKNPLIKSKREIYLADGRQLVQYKSSK